MLKPSHKSIQEFLKQRAQFDMLSVRHETGVRSAFQMLLMQTAPKYGLTLVTEQPLPKSKLRPDGTVIDEFKFRRGYWESKDEQDDLVKEIDKKIQLGYPTTNTIFEDSKIAYLYQNKGIVLKGIPLTHPQGVADLLNEFYRYREPHIEEFDKAVDEFKDRVPDLAAGLVKKIEESHKNNREFRDAFGAFHELCKTSLNPGLRQEAVEEMLVQHLLTERLIGNIFENPEFRQRNVIAAEIEKVIQALTGRHFNRQQYLEGLNRFYVAIEGAAKNTSDFSEKQHLLNSVYERFFQGYAVKVADTHGIVYTPQPIVDFMCASVVEVFETEFNKELGDPDVCIIDPCTGTGNFIVNLLQRIPQKDLPRMYKQQLFANEVMLMPYYIAALNIEHAYFEITGRYEPFEGLCFVDTLDLMEAKQSQLGFMSEKNLARVERQRKAPITVVIGNPPYNANQVNEHDNNRNRTYKALDEEIGASYARRSDAQLRHWLYDMYIRFIKWSEERLDERNGVVCLVTNNGFVDGVAFDGMRKSLEDTFSSIYHLNLKGNARTSGERRKREGGNIFRDKIRVGIGVTLFCKNAESRSGQYLCEHKIDDYLTADEKLAYVEKLTDVSKTKWNRIDLPADGKWYSKVEESDWDSLLPMGTKNSKGSASTLRGVIFGQFGGGVKSNRDDFVFSFGRESLANVVKTLINAYLHNVDRLRRQKGAIDIDEFVSTDGIKWDGTLKARLQKLQEVRFDEKFIVQSQYRPFVRKFYYFDRFLSNSVYQNLRFFPIAKLNNQVLVVTDAPCRAPRPSYLLVDRVPEVHLSAATDAHQCFPFYVYNEDGSGRRENITDWALGEFRGRYGDTTKKLGRASKPDTKKTASSREARPSGAKGHAGEITKWDIFYYVYGILHHPDYRTRYADKLKRELPRIPFAPDFWAFSNAGKQLAELHLKYEECKPYKLKFVETGKRLSYRVEKMKLSKDKREVIVNESLTLAGIPPEVYDYKLGNRSALEWVIDQYQIKTDKRSGITHDPNREDDEEYIVRLIGQVVHVSLETVRIVKGLPKEFR